MKVCSTRQQGRQCLPSLAALPCFSLAVRLAAGPDKPACAPLPDEVGNDLRAKAAEAGWLQGVAGSTGTPPVFPGEQGTQEP